jgi:hypothetical protein
VTGVRIADFISDTNNQHHTAIPVHGDKMRAATVYMAYIKIDADAGDVHRIFHTFGS